MKDIHIIPAISNESSGPTYSVVRLCESLIQQGQDVILAALDLGPISSPPKFLKTFPLGFGPCRLGRSPMMKQWLDNQILNGNIDVLHNHGLWQMNSVYPGWAAKKSKKNINYIVSPRGAFTKYAMSSGSKVKSVFWPLLQRPSLDAVTCFHATAESEYTDIRRLGFRQPIAVIPNGIDIPKSLSKKSADSRILLFLGRIHSNKGLDMLLPAWGAVQNRFPDWRLKIVGSDDGYYGNSGYLDELKSMVKTFDLNRIEFAGELNGIDKLRAYQEAELFVLPSYSENFGMTVAESLAAGTPTIVLKGAPWSGLEKNSAGWWIDIGVEPLTACLENALARSKNELINMGLRGRNWMETEFSWLHISQRMAETYQWLVGDKKSAPDWVRTN